MADAATLTPTSYIQHHLAFLTKPVADGPFWMVNVDTLVVSFILGVVGLGALWLGARNMSSGVPTKRKKRKRPSSKRFRRVNCVRRSAPLI